MWRTVLPRSVVPGTLVLLMVLAGLTSPGRATAQLDATVRAQVPPAIVRIGAIVVVSENEVETEQIVMRGSGTVVSPDGLVLTNHHVVDLADLRAQLATEQAQLERQGRTQRREVVADRFVILTGPPDEVAQARFEAVLAADEPALDLAVLRIDRDAAGAPLDDGVLELPYLPLGDSDLVELGEQVHLFGYPAVGSGLLTYTQGAVSSFDLDEAIAGRAWITTDATVSGGSSGGAAVNAQGLLIGVPTQAGELECRPGDTNGDRVLDERDVGCIPIGGTLNQIRPVNLAKPLLVDACDVCQPGSGESFATATLAVAVEGLAVPYAVETEDEPLLLTLPDGGAMAIFSATVQADGWNAGARLLAARFDPIRNQWLAAQPLPGGEGHSDPSAVVDSEGTIHLVFSARSDDRPESLPTLMYTRSFGQGRWETPGVVAGHPLAGNQTRPSLAIDDTDRLYLVWLDQRNMTTEDRILFPESAGIFFSELRGNAWSSPVELSDFGPAWPGGWLRLVVVDQRLIVLWTVRDRAAEYIRMTERAITGPKVWSEPEMALTNADDTVPTAMVPGQPKVLLGVPQTGESLFATASQIEEYDQRNPIRFWTSSPGSREWSAASTLIDFAAADLAETVSRLSVVAGPDATRYVVFERGPDESREVTVLARAASATLPSPAVMVTADEPGPQRHHAAALGADGALWILYADLDGEPEVEELRVRRWVPDPSTLLTAPEQLLPTEAEVPMPLSLAGGSHGPVQVAAEAPWVSPDPAELTRRLTEDLFASERAIIQFDRIRALPRLREVSIHQLGSPESATAALDYFFNERATEGLEETGAPMYCRHSRGVERYLSGPALVGELPESEEISLFLQWENLLVRVTDVYRAEPGQEFPLACPVLPRSMGARVQLASAGEIPLAEALPTAAETRMIAGEVVERSRAELLTAGPDRPLDAWGWQGNVIQLFTAPETGLTFLEAEVLRLGGPELAATAVTIVADDRAAVGGLAEQLPPDALADGRAARLLTGPAVPAAHAGSFEATIIVQSQEVLLRVTVISPAESPVAYAVAVAETMLSKRLPAGDNADATD